MIDPGIQGKPLDEKWVCQQLVFNDIGGNIVIRMAGYQSKGLGEIGHNPLGKVAGITSFNIKENLWPRKEIKAMLNEDMQVSIQPTTH